MHHLLLLIYAFKTSQQQRDYYKDRSGEIHPIDDFILPNKNQSMYESFLP